MLIYFGYNVQTIYFLCFLIPESYETKEKGKTKTELHTMKNTFIKRLLSHTKTYCISANASYCLKSVLNFFSFFKLIELNSLL